MRASPLLAAALLALLPATAAALDTPTSDAEAAARAAAVRAALPAPADAGPLSFEARILVDGVEGGSGTFKATPGGSAEAPTWSIEEKFLVKGRGERPATVTETTAVLGRDLRLISYARATGPEGGGRDRTVLSWAEGKLRLGRASPEGSETTATLEADPAVTATFTGVLLLARLVPPEPATYRLPVFHQESGTIKPAVVTVEGPRDLETAGGRVATHAVSVLLADQPVRVHLDPKDRSPLVVARDQRGMTVWFAAKGIEPAIPKYEPIDLKGKAASARAAGERYVFGLLTGQTPYIEAAIHWPTFKEAAKKVREVPDDEAAFRAGFLMMLASSMQNLPENVALAKAKAASERATERVADGTTWVTLGGSVAGFGYGAREIDGGWYVVALGRGPGEPGSGGSGR